MANTQSKEEKEGKEKKKKPIDLTTIHTPPMKEEDVETTIQIMWRKFDFNHRLQQPFF